MKNKQLRTKIIQKGGIVLAIMLILLFFGITNNVFAADDPLAVINNLSNFIFGITRAIGMILLFYGVVQLGMSLKGHDPSQRAQGLWTISGGVIITFAKEILNLITGGN